MVGYAGVTSCKLSTVVLVALSGDIEDRDCGPCGLVPFVRTRSGLESRKSLGSVSAVLDQCERKF